MSWTGRGDHGHNGWRPIAASGAATSETSELNPLTDLSTIGTFRRREAAAGEAGTQADGATVVEGPRHMKSQSTGGGERIRRVVESVTAAVLIVAVSPVVLVSAFVSYLSYRAWPFFTHDRVGWRGRAIAITKVRTLPCSTGTHVDKYELRTVVVPPVMRRLRKLHLDELPQLVAVILGRLSFVGPRPEMRTLHDRLGATFARERTSVRPGLTGLWQIGHGSSGLIGESPEYDLFYIRNRTLRMDAWILYRTIVKVMTGTTVGLEDVPSWVLPRAAETVSAVAPSGAAQPSTLAYQSVSSRTPVP